MTFIIGTPHIKGSGYAINDDRTSGGQLTEADIQTCPHCQKVINMQKWKASSVQNFCNRCMKPTCDNKSCVEDCVPYLARFEKVFDAVVKFDQYLKRAGLESRPIPKSLILP